MPYWMSYRGEGKIKLLEKLSLTDLIAKYLQESYINYNVLISKIIILNCKKNSIIFKIVY
jgi:hypothetical protein